MRFNKAVYPYLNGEKFHNGLFVDFIYEDDDIFVDRISFLKKICSNAKIIHLGCADHMPLIEKKIANGSWLHKILTDVSESCLGLDINKETINHIKENLGYNNVYYCDLLAGEIPELEQKQYDYIVLGEMVEHLDDPVFFLKKLRERFQGRVEKIIITCPNAMFYRNMIDFSKNRECINTDHRFWFTPYTLAKVLHQSGANVEKFYFASPKLSKRNFILKIFYNIFPMYQENILTIASL